MTETFAALLEALRDAARSYDAAATQAGAALLFWAVALAAAFVLAIIRRPPRH